MRYQKYRLVATLLAPLALAGVSAQALAETKTVVIENAKFSPATLSVKQGDTVVWHNKDFFPHDVTAKGKVFASNSIAPNATWKFTATKRGTFGYMCTLHPSMTGKLIVK